MSGYNELKWVSIPWSTEWAPCSFHNQTWPIKDSGINNPLRAIFDCCLWELHLHLQLVTGWCYWEVWNLWKIQNQASGSE